MWKRRKKQKELELIKLVRTHPAALRNLTPFQRGQIEDVAHYKRCMALKGLLP